MSTGKGLLLMLLLCIINCWLWWKRWQKIKDTGSVEGTCRSTGNILIPLFIFHGFTPCSISIPPRCYMHNSEMLHKDDIENTIRLMRNIANFNAENNLNYL